MEPLMYLGLAGLLGTVLALFGYFLGYTYGISVALAEDEEDEEDEEDAKIVVHIVTTPPTTNQPEE